MSIKKNKNQLIISILVGLAIFAVSYQFVVKQHQENMRQRAEIEQLKNGIGVNPNAAQENTTIYVIAVKDLEKGHIIEEGDIELKDLGLRMNGTYTDDKILIGREVLDNIQAGQPLTESNVEKGEENIITEEPSPGFRAVAASVSKSKIAPFIKDGVYVDVYTANDTVQAKNVRILKILDGDSDASKIILFEIKEEDVGAFIYAMSTDKLIPVQRNSADKSFYEFASDPFKYSSYAVTSDELSGIDLSEEKPAAVSKGGKSLGLKGTQSVEVIQGNKKETLDF